MDSSFVWFEISFEFAKENERDCGENNTKIQEKTN